MSTSFKAGEPDTLVSENQGIRKHLARQAPPPETVYPHLRWEAKYATDKPSNNDDVTSTAAGSGGSKEQHAVESGQALTTSNTSYGRKEAKEGTADIDPIKQRHTETPSSFETRFLWLGDIADINAAISAQREAVEKTPDGYPTKTSYLDSLSSSLERRFLELADIDDLNAAIFSQREAVAGTIDDNPEKARYLNKLGNLLKIRFFCLRDITDFHTALSCQQEAVRKATDDAKSAFLNDLAAMQNARFRLTRDVADLNAAISSQQEAVRGIADDNRAKPAYLLSLGASLAKRFYRLGQIADTNAAVACMQEAVRITPDGDPAKAAHLNGLGGAYGIRFDQLGDIADISAATSCLREAVRRTPDDNPTKPLYLKSLGTIQGRRFERLGDVADLNAAVSNKQEAVRRTPDYDPSKQGYLNSLGSSLRIRFVRLGNIADLDTAIASFREALGGTADNDPMKSAYMNNLGASLRTRFHRLGGIAELDEAISFQQLAVQICPDEQPAKVGRLDSLGISLKERYDWLGDVADLHAAIASQREAVRRIRNDHPAKPTYLNNLGMSLRENFNRLRDIADLDAAISCQREAVQKTPDGDPVKSIFLNNLGISLQARFDHFGDITDIDATIRTQREAVQKTPDDNPAMAGHLNSLGSALMARFNQLRDIGDVDTAILNFRAALRLVPDGHPDQPVHLNALGHSLKTRFEQLSDIPNLRESILVHRRAAHARTGPSFTRFHATQLWTESARLLDDTTSVLEAYDSALDLLPRLVWIGGNMESRYRDILAARTLACDAAATALASNDPQKALRWLEQGRSIIWGQLLQLRTPVDALREIKPELADNFSQVSIGLERGGSQGSLASSTDVDISAEELAQQRRRLATEWENLVQEIRGLLGFENFLQPKQFAQLREAAGAGPVVVLNVSKFGCDALILASPSDSLRQVRLPEISYDRAFEMQALLRKSLTSGGLRNWGDDEGGESIFVRNVDDVFRTILAELWTSVVKPVLDCLSLHPSQNRPRIWWCPTGPLAFLPIHAAGLYAVDAKEPPCSLADFAISSYTPTLSALITALQKPGPQDPKVLVVIQPSAPGAGRLPGTEKELNRIRKHFTASQILTLERSNANVKAVLSNISEYSWVHFACHGVQDIANPTKSGLIFQDGRLDLSEIIRKPLPQADFAYLSACQTATGDERRPDEAIHLAAGMLLAGYRGVIGSMWSIQDVDAPFVTDRVYARLMEGGQPSSTKAAKALHEAIRALRRRYNDRSFTSWVPYIHVGV